MILSKMVLSNTLLHLIPLCVQDEPNDFGFCPVYRHAGSNMYGNPNAN